MGNRVKGKTKKKSIKVAKSSSMSSSRRLSRMGKDQKADNAGLHATFLSRSAVLKRLQITLKDFRRLCILKGIYPRVPHKAPSAKKGQTFYHIKDVTFVSHEPLLEVSLSGLLWHTWAHICMVFSHISLQSFREFKAYMKKVRKASGKDSKEEAMRLAVNKPSYTLHHLVKERYPRFADALGDLDDALSMVALFGSLPGAGKIKSDVVDRCRALHRSWNAYIAISGSLTKSFVSVKGIYFEAEVQGVAVRWVVPHTFTQNVPTDVDFRVMSTFVEFYEVLVNFVLYKLFGGINLKYPVKVVSGDDGGIGGMIRAVREGVGGNVVDVVAQNSTNSSKSTKKTQAKSVEGMDIDDIVGGSDEESDSDDNEEDNDALDAGNLATVMIASVAADGSLEDKPVTSADSSTTSLFAGLTFFVSREVPRHIVELIALSYGAKCGWEGPGSSIVASDPAITHFVMDRPVIPASYGKLPKNREYVQPQWVMDCANFEVLLPVGKYGVGVKLPPHLSPWVDNEAEGYTPRYAEEIAMIKRGEEFEEEEVVEEEEAVVEEEGSEEESGEESGEESDDEVVEKKLQQMKEAKMDDPKELAKTMMSKKAARLYGRMQHGLNERQSHIDNLENKRAKIEKDERKAAREGRAEKRDISIISKDEMDEIDMNAKSGKRRVEQKIEGRKKVEGKSATKQKFERLASERVDENRVFDKEIKKIKKAVTPQSKAGRKAQKATKKKSKQ